MRHRPRLAHRSLTLSPRQRSRFLKTNQSDSNRQFGALQSLRGLFAIFIFLHHTGVFQAGGDMGVAFFLVLSGFVMTSGYGNRVLERHFRLLPYMRRRMARLFPLHLACFIMAVAIMPTSLSPAGALPLLCNLALVQSWVPAPQFFFSANSVAWCLSDLMFLYLIFPFLRRIVKALDTGVLAAIAIALIAAYVVLILFLLAEWQLPLIYINPVMRIPDFIIGMSIALLLFPLQRRHIPLIIEIAAMLLIPLWVIGYHFMPQPLALAAWWWPLCGVIIIVFARPAHLAAKLGAWLSTPILVKAGELSFSFYMVHQLVIRALRRMSDHFNLDLGIALYILIAFIISCLAAWLINRYIEKPAAAWLLNSGNFKKQKLTKL